MGLEAASYVSDLVSSNPTSTDNQSQGDDHLRLLKSVLQTSFPNASKAFRFPSEEAIKTANYNLVFPDDQNKVLRFNATSGNITVTVPTMSGVNAPGWSCIIVRSDDTSGKSVTISGGTIGGWPLLYKAGAVLLTYFSSSSSWWALPMRDIFAATTAMLFAQATAPLGWTKSTTHNNKALRLVTGSTGGSAGGTTAFTSVFAARTITQANLPNITLTAASDGAHTHDIKYNGNNFAGGGFAAVQTITSGGATTAAAAALSSGAHTHTVPLGGSGTAMDFAVQYVDVIIATKDT